MLYFLFTNYVGFTLEIQVNGGTATNRTQFCIGEVLTLVCRGVTTSYIWEIPPLITGMELLATIVFRMNSFNNFNATFVSDTESTLVFVASMNLNDTVISCINGAAAGAPIFSSTTLLLHGKIFVSTQD